MDSQMKKGMMEACILSVLSRGDSYGYQLIKDMEPIMRLSESTLYPVLRRLEAAGCLTVYSVEHNSRLRKYYAITDEGRKRIVRKYYAITDEGRKKIADFLAEWAEVKRVYDFIAEVNVGV